MKVQFIPLTLIQVGIIFVHRLWTDKSVSTNKAHSPFTILTLFAIVLWNVLGENENYNVLRGHKNAVIQVQWYSAGSILSASADKTVAIWDANRGNRIRKFTEHTAIVNTCAAARDNELRIASGSDDCTAILWDPRTKNSIDTIYHDYQLCSVTFSHDGNFLFTAGIDNIIR